MIQKKVCLLGAFAVGKTSLVRRFVSDVYDDAYLTTVGVRIEKKDVAVGGRSLRLLLWDLHGEDRFQFVQPAHLRGAAGLLMVVDGTRPQTVATADTLLARAQDTLGEVPRIVLLNKADLHLAVTVDELRDRFGPHVQATSAKLGTGVQDAFEALVHRL